jgi:hypothetical protein
MMITTCLIGLFVISAFGVADADVPGGGEAVACMLAPGFGDALACGAALGDPELTGAPELDEPGARVAIPFGPEPTVAPPSQAARAAERAYRVAA